MEIDAWENIRSISFERIHSSTVEEKSILIWQVFLDIVFKDNIGQEKAIEKIKNQQWEDLEKTSFRILWIENFITYSSLPNMSWYWKD